MILKYSLLVAFILHFGYLIPLSGQDEQNSFTYPRSEDIGLNITKVISSFIGNSNTDIDLADFPFAVKINRKNKAWRFGIGAKVKNTDETIFGTEQIIFNNFALHSRFGLEWKKYLGKNIGFFGGIDLVNIFSNEVDIVSNNIDISTITTNTIGGGGGPVFGFEYFLGDKMYFATEGNLYGIFKYTDRQEEFRNNPNINVEKVVYNFDAVLTPPVQLYLIVRF